MKKLTPNEITDNLFSLVNDEWMLITAVDNDGKVNTMTASWGCFGILWNKPVAVCFVRPQRYTYRFTEEAPRMTLSFLKPGYREALKLCGTKSGRDMNKIEAAGLHTVNKDGVAYFEEARLVVTAKKLYVSDLKEECFLDGTIPSLNYPKKDYHRVYICEIEDVMLCEDA